MVQLDKIIESTVPQGRDPKIVQESLLVTKPQITIPDTVTPIKPSTAPRRSSRLHLEPEWFHNEVFIMEDDEPANYGEAMVSPTSTEWHKAMKSEI